MRRPAAFALGMVAILGACFGDRPRPLPLDPDLPDLEVQVLAPPQNSTAFAGHPVRVDVLARDLGGTRLIAFGIVAYRPAGNVRIDSVLTVLPVSSAAARDTFEFTIPADYATNTQVDIYGVAVGEGGARQTSVPRSILAVQCQTSDPLC